jgi:hypothetical protein
MFLLLCIQGYSFCEVTEPILRMIDENLKQNFMIRWCALSATQKVINGVSMGY